MKKNLLLTIAVLGIAMAFSPRGGEKLTLKERIDQAKEIKVYFSNMDVVHNPNTNATAGSQAKGTGCPKFNETTPLTAEYIDAVKQVIDLLNKGFNTSVFVAGDLSTVPVFSTGIQKGNPDWLKLGEPLTVYIVTSGTYEVRNIGLMGEVKNTNSLSVISSLIVYGINEGKIKVLANKNLASKSSPNKETKECDKYDYFVSNFPLSSLAEVFKSSIVENTTEFTTKEMANYDKAMKKK